MTYPIESLGIIGPIVLIALLAGFAVIGLFGGWKRAAYWGGGNFVWYITGMLVFRFAGESIVNLFAPLVANILKNFGLTEADIKPVLVAATGIVLFLIIFLIGNLLLLINYYAWVKRVIGIKKEVAAKKEIKRAKKEGLTEISVENSKNYKIAKYKVQNEDLIRVQTKKYKVLNKTFGCVGMFALMAPFTMTFSQSILIGTTTASTRVKNGFVDGTYNFLHFFNEKMSWATYYGDTTYIDIFDSGLACAKMTLTEKKKWVGQYHKADGTAVSMNIEGGHLILFASSMIATFEILLQSCTFLADYSYEVLITDQMKTAIKTIIDDVIYNWNAYNNLFTPDEIDINTIFKQEDAVNIFAKIVQQSVKQLIDIKCTQTQIAKLKADNNHFLASIAQAIVNNNGKLVLTNSEGTETTEIDIGHFDHIIPINQSSKANLKTLIYYAVSKDETDPPVETDLRDVLDKFYFTIFKDSGK